MKASVLSLRRRMGDILKALDRNEPVTILHRGREKGVLYPVGAHAKKRVSVAEHEVFGMWKDRSDLQDVEGALRKMRKERGHAV